MNLNELKLTWTQLDKYKQTPVNTKPSVLPIKPWETYSMNGPGMLAEAKLKKRNHVEKERLLSPASVVLILSQAGKGVESDWQRTSVQCGHGPLWSGKLPQSWSRRHLPQDLGLTIHKLQALKIFGYVEKCQQLSWGAPFLFVPLCSSRPDFINVQVLAQSWQQLDCSSWCPSFLEHMLSWVSVFILLDCYISSIFSLLVLSIILLHQGLDQTARSSPCCRFHKPTWYKWMCTLRQASEPTLLLWLLGLPMICWCMRS